MFSGCLWTSRGWVGERGGRGGGGGLEGRGCETVGRGDEVMGVIYFRRVVG